MTSRSLRRRAGLAVAAVATALSLSVLSAGPAHAGKLYGRIDAGGCVVGIPVIVNGVALCYVV